MATTIAIIADMFDTNDEMLESYGLDRMYLRKMDKRAKHVIRQMLCEDIFVVYAENHGNNGWAVVMGKNKSDARRNAYDGWLDTARVVSVIPFSEYVENNRLSFGKIDSIMAKLDKNKHFELEWGC